MPSLNDDTLLAILSQLDDQDILLASHVDRYWRSVAVGTASLWRTITLDATSVSADSRFRTILRRSSISPLGITACIGTPHGPCSADVRLLLQTVACERGRIHALDLCLALQHLEGLFCALRDGLPGLTSLEIFVESITPLPDDNVRAFPVEFPSYYVPLLRRLCFTGICNGAANTSDFAALFSSFPNMRILTLWLGNDLPEMDSSHAKGILRRLGSLDELHVHKCWEAGPCNISSLLTDHYNLRARHVALYSVVSAQYDAFSKLLEKLSAEERASLRITLSDAARNPASHRYSHTMQPPRYQIHALCLTTGRIRMVTCTYYSEAMWNAVSVLRGCRDLCVVGDSGWRLLCSAYRCQGTHIHTAALLHCVRTLRITVVSLPLQEVNRGRRKLRLPALGTIVLRAQPELGQPVAVHAAQLLQLLRRFTTYPPNTIDVQTVAITLHGDFQYFPQHVTLNGKVPPVVGYRGICVRGRQHHVPVEDMALYEIFP